MMQPIVSVVMITYGHEKFIEQAINGVLMQECDFEIELIISNDSSPDKTDSVIHNILLSHPQSNRIRYFKQEKNIGMMPNFVFALQQAQGKYIALCEGDDYWIDSKKLQKQVDFLEQNPDFSMCFHKAAILNQTNGPENSYFPEWENDKELSYLDFIYPNNTPTCSAVFSKKFIDPIPQFFIDSPYGDLVLYNTIMLRSRQKTYFFNEVMSVYRIHVNGIHSSLLNAINGRLKICLNDLKYLELLKKEFYPNEDKVVKTLLSVTRRYITLSIEQRNFSRFMDGNNKLLSLLKFHQSREYLMNFINFVFKRV